MLIHFHTKIVQIYVHVRFIQQFLYKIYYFVHMVFCTWVEFSDNIYYYYFFNYRIKLIHICIAMFYRVQKCKNNN